VTPQWCVFYFDGVEYWRAPTPPEHKHPLMVLVDLGLGGGWPIDQAPSPAYMYVDYIRVYAPPNPATPPPPPPPPSASPASASPASESRARAWGARTPVWRVERSAIQGCFRSRFFAGLSRLCAAISPSSTLGSVRPRSLNGQSARMYCG